MSITESSKPKAIDLFSGCGGLSLGLRSAGIKVLAAVENEPLACKTYRRNHPAVRLIQADIRTVSPYFLMQQLGLREGDLDLPGCPPCQGFSTLRTLNGSRRVF